jgi:hypothetical protein
VALLEFAHGGVLGGARVAVGVDPIEGAELGQEPHHGAVFFEGGDDVVGAPGEGRERGATRAGGASRDGLELADGEVFCREARGVETPGGGKPGDTSPDDDDAAGKARHIGGQGVEGEAFFSEGAVGALATEVEEVAIREGAFGARREELRSESEERRAQGELQEVSAREGHRQRSPSSS